MNKKARNRRQKGGEHSGDSGGNLCCALYPALAIEVALALPLEMAP